MAETDVGRLEQDVTVIRQDVRRLSEGQAALGERMARLRAPSPVSPETVREAVARVFG